MADPTSQGPLTTDGIPYSLKYTVFNQDVGFYNETTGKYYRDLLCGPSTTSQFEDVSFQGMKMEPMGQDTTEPRKQHIPRYRVTLKEPMRWGLGSAITRESYERGMSSREVDNHMTGIMTADYDLVQQTILKAALTNGGFYAGDMTPPAYQGKVFASSHTHYLAENAAGAPALAHFTAMKEEMLHHGHRESSMVALINSAQASKIENAAEWINQPGPMPSTLMDRLQQVGMGTSMEAAGVPVARSEWIPAGYIAMFALEPGLEPLRWRIPEGPGVDQLIIAQADPSSLGIQWIWQTEAARWISATVAVRSAGVVMYLGSGTWTDPTTFDSRIP
jgi:hypothetical protein